MAILPLALGALGAGTAGAVGSGSAAAIGAGSGLLGSSLSLPGMGGSSGGGMKSPPAEMAGMAIGLGQTVLGSIKKAQANKLGPPLEDPEQRSYLNEIKRKKRQLETGTSPEFRFATDLLGRNLANTQRNISKMAGGGVGQTLQGFNQSLQTAGQSTAQIGAQQQQAVGYYQQLAGKLIGDMAQRKMDLQMWEKLQKLREASELQKSGGQNVMAGLGLTLPTDNT